MQKQIVQLPSNYQRIADTFSELEPGEKEAVIGELRTAKDAGELSEKADEIIKRGGAQAELCARIFQRNFEGVDADKGGVRNIENKRLTPVQTKEGGTGGVLHLPAEEPHTSSVNPPKSGHPGPSDEDQQASEESGQQ